MDLYAPEIYGDAAIEEVPANESESEGVEAVAPEVLEPTAAAEAEPMMAEAPAEAPPIEEPAAVEAPDNYAVAAPAAFQPSLTLGVKEQTALNGMALSGGQAVTYVSSKPKIVSVDGNGLVLARKKGKAEITVYQGETALGACSVTVLKAPKKVVFPEKSIVMSKDQTRAFPASLPKGCAGAVSYSSDNTAVLTVDAAGNLRGVAGGSATVTATAYNGRKATCAVRVLGGPAPTWVKLNQSAVSLPVKGTAQLTASFDEGRDALLTYSTSNKKIATVNANGLITAKKAGQATITVTTHNGLTAACAVQVYIQPKKITLNTKKLTMHINDGYQLIATLTKNSVSTITWSSDNTGVATVDGNGMV
ncbi:MAG: Ig domain-containing protein, partial [Clostridia bacterium]|nr:Ig domain-containing protein [Clostridia bacterium]